MNRNFASIDADRKFTFAPDGVIYECRFHTRPTAEMYAANGYLPFLDERPVEIGYTFAPLDTATERDGVLYRDYERREIPPMPPPVTRYSKLKLIVAAKQAGKWDAFKAFIASAGYEDEWAACQFLSSDYAQFNAAKAAIVAEGIATAEEVDAILAASVDEEVR